MTEEMTDAKTAKYAVRLGDDALVLGQRLCEWCSKAPTLEEDLALANVGLDYLGRARMLYGYAGELLGRSEDEFAYTRDAREFENVLLVELPRGDFAFTMVRQYLLDEFEEGFFECLAGSTDEQLAAVAVRTGKEVRYHKRRSGEWLRRLGLGTQESNRRAQEALDELWGYVAELFAMDGFESELAEAGIAIWRAELEPAWRESVGTLIEASGLSLPGDDWQVQGGRSGVHTEHLGHMLSELQFLQRAYPGAEW